MTCLLDVIAQLIPVTDVPELLIQLFLPGDDCLDDATIDQVFTKMYKHYYDDSTYLDPGNTVLHSFADQPAKVGTYTQYWYRNGKLHRDNDLPAVIGFRTREWFQNGELHRDGDKPAYVMKRRDMRWYKNGQRHRDGHKPDFINIDDFYNKRDIGGIKESQFINAGFLSPDWRSEVKDWFKRARKRRKK